MKDLIKDFKDAMDKDHARREEIALKAPLVPLPADIDEMINISNIKKLLLKRKSIEALEGKLIDNNDKLTKIRDSIRKAISAMGKDEAVKQTIELLATMTKLDNEMVIDIQKSLLEKIND